MHIPAWMEKIKAGRRPSQAAMAHNDAPRHILSAGATEHIPLVSHATALSPIVRNQRAELITRFLQLQPQRAHGEETLYTQSLKRKLYTTEFPKENMLGKLYKAMTKSLSKTADSVKTRADLPCIADPAKSLIVSYVLAHPEEKQWDGILAMTAGQLSDDIAATVESKWMGHSQSSAPQRHTR